MIVSRFKISVINVLAGLSFLSFYLACAVVVYGEEPARKESGFTYNINNPREPFMPLVLSDGTIVNFEPQSDISDIHLEGIIFDPGGKSFAVINGNVIAENDNVGNFKLKEIKKDKIILQNGQNSHIIELIKEDAGEQK